MLLGLLIVSANDGLALTLASLRVPPLVHSTGFVDVGALASASPDIVVSLLGLSGAKSRGVGSDLNVKESRALASALSVILHVVDVGALVAWALTFASVLVEESLASVLKALFFIGARASALVGVALCPWSFIAKILRAVARVASAVTLASSLVEGMIVITHCVTEWFPGGDVTEAITERFLSCVRKVAFQASSQRSIALALAIILVLELPIGAIDRDALALALIIAPVNGRILALCRIGAFADTQFAVELGLVLPGRAVSDTIASASGLVLLETFSTVDASALAGTIIKGLVLIILAGGARFRANTVAVGLIELGLWCDALLDTVAQTIILVLSIVFAKFFARARDTLALTSLSVPPLSSRAGVSDAFACAIICIPIMVQLVCAGCSICWWASARTVIGALDLALWACLRADTVVAGTAWLEGRFAGIVTTSKRVNPPQTNLWITLGSVTLYDSVSISKEGLVGRDRCVEAFPVGITSRLSDTDLVLGWRKVSHLPVTSAVGLSVRDCTRVACSTAKADLNADILNRKFSVILDTVIVEITEGFSHSMTVFIVMLAKEESRDRSRSAQVNRDRLDIFNSDNGIILGGKGIDVNLTIVTNLGDGQLDISANSP